MSRNTTAPRFTQGRKITRPVENFLPQEEVPASPLPRKVGFRATAVAKDKALVEVPPGGIPGEDQEARFARLTNVGTVLIAALKGVNISDENTRKKLVTDVDFFKEEVAKAESLGKKLNANSARDILSRYTNEDDRKILRNVVAINEASRASGYADAKNNFLFIGGKLGPTNDRGGLGLEFREKFSEKLQDLGIEKVALKAQNAAPQELEEDDIVREVVSLEAFEPRKSLDLPAVEETATIANQLESKEDDVVKDSEIILEEDVVDRPFTPDSEISEDEEEIISDAESTDIEDEIEKDMTRTMVEEGVKAVSEPVPEVAPTAAENAPPQVIKRSEDKATLRNIEQNKKIPKEFGDTDIMHAIRTGSHERVIDVIASQHETIAAKKSNEAEIIKEAAQNLTLYRNDNYENPLHLALRSGDERIAKLVVDYVLTPLSAEKQAALLNKKSVQYDDKGAMVKGETPLEIARQNGRVEMLTNKGIALEAQVKQAAAPKVAAEESQKESTKFRDMYAARASAGQRVL